MTKGSVLACLLAGGVGLGAGLVIAERSSSNVQARRDALQPRPDRSESPAQPPDGEREPNPGEPPRGDESARRRPGPSQDARPVVNEQRPAGTAREVQLAHQIQELKKHEAETRQQLEALQRELDGRENLDRSFAPRQFDLRPEDWRKLGREGTLKLRIPCPVSPGDDLTKQQLERLGLVPEDAPVITAAFQHSADRVWAAIGPLCAEVLGVTPELAAARGPNMCRRLIFREAARNGTALPAFQRAAAVLAGDAPARTEPSAVESLVLALAQEQDRLEHELAEYFGPAEADRLVFSEGLCFTEAVHQLGARDSRVESPAPALEGSR